VCPRRYLFRHLIANCPSPNLKIKTPRNRPKLRMRKRSFEMLLANSLVPGVPKPPGPTTTADATTAPATTTITTTAFQQGMILMKQI
jgi:hypothetical protein